MAFFRKLPRGKGQGVVEYAILLALVVILMIGLLANNTSVKSEVSESFGSSVSTLHSSTNQL